MWCEHRCGASWFHRQQDGRDPTWPPVTLSPGHVLSRGPHLGTPGHYSILQRGKLRENSPQQSPVLVKGARLEASPPSSRTCAHGRWSDRLPSPALTLPPGSSLHPPSKDPARRGLPDSHPCFPSQLGHLTMSLCHCPQHTSQSPASEPRCPVSTHSASSTTCSGVCAAHAAPELRPPR